jgi:cytochrome c-type biogenesis protein CcmH/NrfG
MEAKGKAAVMEALGPTAPARHGVQGVRGGAATLEPTTKVDHLELARQAFNQRDWMLALAEAKAATAAGGGADAHALVGNTYFKMGHFADAEKAYARAVALEPRNALLQERLRIAHARAEQAKSGR